MRRITTKGLNLLKTFEGCSLKSYKDVAGIWTIGYGHTGPEVVEGMTITQVQAELMLLKDLERFYKIEDYIDVKLNSNQYDALICLVYNIGISAFRTSTVLKKLNKGEPVAAAWCMWNRAKGKVIPGLAARRQSELTLFNTKDET